MRKLNDKRGKNMNIAKKKHTRKSLLSLCLFLSMLIVSGCGSADNNTEQGKSSNQYQIGICQLTKHTALDSATQGFQDAVKERLGDKVTFEVQVCDGEKESCATAAAAFVDNNVDLIMANATPALQAAYQATNSIPIVATSITDYGTALNIRNWSGVTGINVTGTSDLAPIEEQEKLFKELLPDAKSIGIVYCNAEANSVYQVQKIKSALEADGIGYQEFVATNKDEVEKVAKEAASKSDAIYIPTDNTVAEKSDVLKEIFTEAKIPAITGEEGTCVAGIATLSIDYYSIGYSAGQMAADILLDGKDPASMEIQYSDKFTKKYNASNCELLGIEVTDEYESMEQK